MLLNQPDDPTDCL